MKIFIRPFTDKIFKLISLQKNKIKILMGNLSTSINVIYTVVRKMKKDHDAENYFLQSAELTIF